MIDAETGTAVVHPGYADGAAAAQNGATYTIALERGWMRYAATLGEISAARRVDELRGYHTQFYLGYHAVQRWRQARWCWRNV